MLDSLDGINDRAHVIIVQQASSSFFVVVMTPRLVLDGTDRTGWPVCRLPHRRLVRVVTGRLGTHDDQGNGTESYRSHPALGSETLAVVS
jgi:hypothetical protein